MKISELNAGQPIIDSSGLMVQHFRNKMLALVRGHNVPISFTAVTGAYTVVGTDFFVDCTGGTYTVTLPTAAGIKGRAFIVKNSDTGTITLDGDGAETIDGAATKALAQWDFLRVTSDGVNWKIG